MKVSQLCLTLCNPMDYTVHGILQARIPEWVDFPFQGIFPTQGLNPDLLHCRWIIYQLSHKGSPRILEWGPVPSPGYLPDPGIEPGSPALQANSLPAKLHGKSIYILLIGAFYFLFPLPPLNIVRIYACMHTHTQNPRQATSDSCLCQRLPNSHRQV